MLIIGDTLSGLTNVGTIVAIITSLISTGISVYTLRVAEKKDKRQVKVKLSYGVLTYTNGTVQGMLFLTASNPGNRAVTVTGPGLLVPDGHQVVFPQPEGDVRFPHDLAEGKDWRVWIPPKELAQQLQEQGYTGAIKLRGFYHSPVGATYKSKPFVFQIDSWIKDKD